MDHLVVPTCDTGHDHHVIGCGDRILSAPIDCGCLMFFFR